ncbi:MAG TPA: xanthine dehydrogenase family protein subunit M [Thermoanaerobaculia bacterium]|nr:xanthine dehydrogenase family protein subunit M [Thermoanaerobaculia bacterium]
MRNFEFHRPQSVADAVALLKGNDAAKLLAGGQSLLPVMKLDLAQPEVLVSLAKVAGLKEIRSAGNNLVIGALVTHAEVAASPEVRRRIPGLADLAGGIGDAQIRNRGTLGGSLAHADPAADYPAAVLALGATIVTDRRQIAADDYFTGMFQTALAADEVITSVHFPVPECAAYAKFSHPASKYAVVGVMVAKTPMGSTGVRVAVTGAGAKVFRVPAYESALAAKLAPEAIAAGAVAPGDLRSGGEASPEYLAHLVTVMAKRAVQACR